MIVLPMPSHEAVMPNNARRAVVGCIILVLWAEAAAAAGAEQKEGGDKPAPLPAAVSGRVTDAGGKPLSGAVVSLRFWKAEPGGQGAGSGRAADSGGRIPAPLDSPRVLAWKAETVGD